MKLYEQYEREFDRTAHLYNDDKALEIYNDATHKLSMISWVENFPSDVPFVQGQARAFAKRLGFNLWKTYPRRTN